MNARRTSPRGSLALTDSDSRSIVSNATTSHFVNACSPSSARTLARNASDDRDRCVDKAKYLLFGSRMPYLLMTWSFMPPCERAADAEQHERGSLRHGGDRHERLRAARGQIVARQTRRNIKAMKLMACGLPHVCRERSRTLSRLLQRSVFIDRASRWAYTSSMIRTVEAIVDEQGRVRLAEHVQLPRAQRALVTILDEEPALRVDEITLLSESALAEDWNRPEEDAAWSNLREGP